MPTSQRCASWLVLAIGQRSKVVRPAGCQGDAPKRTRPKGWGCAAPARSGEIFALQQAFLKGCSRPEADLHDRHQTRRVAPRTNHHSLTPLRDTGE